MTVTDVTCVASSVPVNVIDALGNVAKHQSATFAPSAPIDTAIGGSGSTSSFKSASVSFIDGGCDPAMSPAGPGDQRHVKVAAVACEVVPDTAKVEEST